MGNIILLNSHGLAPPAPTPYTEGRFDVINVSMNGNSTFYPMVCWRTDAPAALPQHLYNENVDVLGGYSTYAGWTASVSKPTITADSVYSAAARLQYITDPTYTILDHGNTPSTRGTSQYVPGTYPVPTTNRLEVGAGKTYSTVLAAYNAATDGDNIVIFPGTYDCTDFANTSGNDIEKNVRFYGSTENHADVTLTGTPGINWWFQIWPYRMQQLTTERPGFYHLTLSRDLYNWRHHITIRSEV